MKLNSLIRAVGAAAVALLAPACIDLEQKLVLNPDGSGKITLSTAMAVPDLGGLGGFGEPPSGDKPKKSNPKEDARELAVAIMRAEGIDAWSDVSYGVGKDGKTRATVTGYFPDATKVRIGNPMSDGGDKEDLGITKSADGNWVIEQKLGDKKKADKPDPKAGDDKKEDGEKKEAPKTDDEVEEALMQERQQWAGMKAFMGMFLDSLRLSYSIECGGTITETAMFEKKGENKATFEMTGKKMMEAVDELLQDDDRAKEMIRKGGSATAGEGGPEELFKGAFGGDGTLRLVIKPGAPAFDYAAEMAKAKAAETPDIKKLREDAKKPAKKGGALKMNLPGFPGGGGEDEPEAEKPADPPPAKTPPPAKKKPKPAKVD